MQHSVVPSYLLRHWRGELPLARAYWINAVTVNLAVRLFLYLFVTLVVQRLPVSLVLLLTPLFWLCLPLLVTWQVVGIARSAGRYAKETGTTTNPVLAWVGIVIMGGAAVTGFTRSGVPQMVDFIQIIRGDPEWPDPVITLLPTGREIEFSGLIKFGSAAKLERQLAEHPDVKVLQLDTGGGREREALAMASVVRRHKLDTYVGLHCESGGVLVFIAGKERTLRNDARIGFHTWRAPGVADAAISDQQIDLLMAAGANTAFTEHVINTPSDSMWYPTPQEMVDQGLATRVTNGSGFSLGSRELKHYTAAGLNEELQGNPLFKALSKREPDSYDLAVKHAAGLIAGGADMVSSLKGLNDLLATATKEAYLCASDTALDACLDLNIEVLKRNMYRAPRETLMVLSQKAPKGAVPDYPYDSDSRYIVALLASPLIPVPPMDPSQAAKEAKELLMESAKDKDAVKLFGSIPEDRMEQIALCEIMNDYLAAIRGLPPERRFPLIRLNFGLGPQQAKAIGAQRRKNVTLFDDLNLKLGPGR
jgi:ATP-dependent protease ClpP protease subunit